LLVLLRKGLKRSLFHFSGINFLDPSDLPVFQLDLYAMRMIWGFGQNSLYDTLGYFPGPLVLL